MITFACSDLTSQLSTFFFLFIKYFIMRTEPSGAPPAVLESSPLTYLQSVAQSPPSHQFLPHLAGDIVSSLKQSSELSAPYLYAVAQHYPTFRVAISSAAMAPPDGTTATASREGEHSQYMNTILSVSFQLKRESVMLYFTDVHSNSIILHSFPCFCKKAIGLAASQCQPRTEITRSGILSVLSQQLPPPSLLYPIHVEFIQACIFAEQYSFAETHVSESWPRPSSAVSVTHVLRYYYLRGCVHMACGSKRLAIRCFWTCLSIPGEAVSAIQIAAWKKMVLVQCLRLSEQGYVSDSLDPLAFPKAASERMNRLINLALSMQPPNTSNEAEDDPEIVHMVEATAPVGDEDDLVEADGAGTDKTDTKKSQATTMSLYGHLAKDFVSVDRAAFSRTVEENRNVFVEDGNLGMVQQCQQALIRRQICQLSSFYSVISLQRLAEMLNMDEGVIKCLLLKLAVDHAWEIGIQETDQGTIVTLPPFSANDAASSASDMMELALLVRDLDVSIATSSKYASIVQKENNKHGREKSSRHFAKGIEDF